MNERTRENFLSHAFNKHDFNLKYYKDHMKEKHDYNVWYYQHNKDKWAIKGGTNADGSSTNARPTSKTETVDEQPENRFIGPKQRVKGRLEKVADGLLKHIPGYGQLYDDVQDFARPFLKAAHAVAGWKTPGKGFASKKMNISISDVKNTLNLWEKRINDADKQIQDFKNAVTSFFNV